jgi:uroporphyrinogen III methyltransferase/synthase
MDRPIVANTRDEGVHGPLARALRNQGLESMSCPTIAIAPPDDEQPLLDAMARLSQFNWVIFTSAHAVEAVSRLPQWRQAASSAALPRVAAVGEASAARLRTDSVVVDVVADGSGATALANAIAGVVGAQAGVRVLWPRGDLAQMAFAETLERTGATVTSPIAYRTLAPDRESVELLVVAIAANRLAAIAFCSPSSALNLARGLGLDDLSSLRGRVQMASIGPTTSAALRELGVEVDVQAATPSVVSLAQAIASRLRVSTGERG